MRTLNLKSQSAILALMIIGWGLSAWAAPQSSPAGTVPVSVIVSVEMKHEGQVPAINREDVRVMQGDKRLEVTDWVPYQGEHAGLDLFVLLDDAANSDIAAQFGDLRDFINHQPPTTAIGLAYMREGSAQIVQNLTKEPAQVGRALRMPIGSAGISPSAYLSVSDLIKRWPESSARREMLVISSGIDSLSPGPIDPYMEAAIQQAQRAGIQVYSIYVSSGGHFGHTFWRSNQGQNNLSQLTDETGGELYYQGLETPVAFKPFLNEFADRLAHQYRLTFLARAESKPGYQHVKLETEVANAELVTQDKVFVAAAK